jgi:hypothetical protein
MLVDLNGDGLPDLVEAAGSGMLGYAVPGDGRNQAVGDVYQNAGACFHHKGRQAAAYRQGTARRGASRIEGQAPSG